MFRLDRNLRTLEFRIYIYSQSFLFKKLIASKILLGWVAPSHGQRIASIPSLPAGLRVCLDQRHSEYALVSPSGSKSGIRTDTSGFHSNDIGWKAKESVFHSQQGQRFCLQHTIHTCSLAHPAFYIFGTGPPFPEAKAADS
jgi:hypothetical protein